MFHRLQIFSAFIIDLYKAYAICVRHLAHNVLRTADVVVFSVTLVFSQRGPLLIRINPKHNTLLRGRLTTPVTNHTYWSFNVLIVRGGTEKSLARPGRKQATANKLWIYSTYPPWSSIHFLACCSNFWKPLKKNSEGCPSNQSSAAAMTSASDEKWRPFSCFFSPENRW